VVPRLQVLFLILQPAFYSLRPLFTRPKTPQGWEAINFAAQVRWMDDAVLSPDSPYIPGVHHGRMTWCSINSFCSLYYSLRPLFTRPKTPQGWEAINFAAQVMMFCIYSCPPSYCRIKWFSICMCLLVFLSYSLRPLFTRPKTPQGWEAINFAAQVWQWMLSFSLTSRIVLALPLQSEQTGHQGSQRLI
jgi:hypothetical protein